MDMIKNAKAMTNEELEQATGGDDVTLYYLVDIGGVLRLRPATDPVPVEPVSGFHDFYW